jgi:hypothetical protein
VAWAVFNSKEIRFLYREFILQRSLWQLLRSGVWEAMYGDGNWELVPESGLNFCVCRRLKSPRRNHCDGDFWPSAKHKTKLILKTSETACLIHVYMRRSTEYLRCESWNLSCISMTKPSVVDQNNMVWFSSVGLWPLYMTHWQNFFHSFHRLICYEARRFGRRLWFCLQNRKHLLR